MAILLFFAECFCWRNSFISSFPFDWKFIDLNSRINWLRSRNVQAKIVKIYDVIKKLISGRSLLFIM